MCRYIYLYLQMYLVSYISGALTEYLKKCPPHKENASWVEMSESHFFIPNCAEIDNQDVLTQGVTVDRDRGKINTRFR